MASTRRRYPQVRLSKDLRISCNRDLALLDDNSAKSTGRQLTPSDQHMVNILKPVKYLPVEWSLTRQSSSTNLDRDLS
jgi:hypothetical protein